MTNHGPMTEHGHSHLAIMPSLVAVQPTVFHHNRFAAQALVLPNTDEWIISVIAPQSIHWQVAPSDAREMVRVLNYALADYEALKLGLPIRPPG